MKTPRIRWMRFRRDVDGLIDALGYTRVVPVGGGEKVDAGAPIRRRALEALDSLAQADDVAEIGVALEDRDPTVRRVALRVVRNLGPAGAFDALARAVVSPSLPAFEIAREESLMVLRELAGRGERNVVRKLALAATDGGVVVALDELTRNALQSFAEEAAEPQLTTLVDELINRLPAMNGSLENAQAVLTWLAPYSTQPLIGALERNVGVRGPVAAVLGEIRDSQALQPLVGMLEDQRADVRRAAVWALGELRDPRTAEALMRATMDDAYEVRCQAGEALDAMGSVAFMAGVATMIRSLEDRAYEPTVARLVEESLERGPSTSRSEASEHGEQSWTPSFIERLQLGRRES